MTPVIDSLDNTANSLDLAALSLVDLSNIMGLIFAGAGGITGPSSLNDVDIGSTINLSSLPQFNHGGFVNGFDRNIRTGIDSVLARVTPGEFVMKPSIVDRFGLDFFDHLNTTGNIKFNRPRNLSQVSEGGSGETNVEIRINNTGAPIDLAIQSTRRENNKIIINAIVGDARNSGPITKAIKKALR